MEAATRVKALTKALKQAEARAERDAQQQARSKVKAAEADAADARRELEEHRWRLAEANRARNYFQATAEKVLDSNAVMAEQLAAVTAQLAKARASEARMAKMTALASRQVGRDARKELLRLENERKAEAAELQRTKEAVRTAEARASEAEAALADIEAVSTEAMKDAEAARAEAMAQAEEAVEARGSQRSLEHSLSLLQEQLSRCRERKEVLVKQRGTLPASRTKEEWAELSAGAFRKAQARERAYLGGLFSSHNFRMQDVAAAIAEMGCAEELFMTKPLFTLHYEAVKKLMTKLEMENFGEQFGLFLHCELHVPFAKVLLLTQAGCKKFNHVLDKYESVPLLYDRHHKGEVIMVPRIAPPRSKLEPLIRRIQEQLGVEHSENGLLAFRSLAVVIQELLAQDPGSCGMPALPFFLGGAHPLPLVISLDATGHGAQQLNTIALKNPYLPQSAQLLRIFGLGNCSDDRNGSTRLLGPNLNYINGLLEATTVCLPVGTAAGAATATIAPMILGVFDVSALRHLEHVAASGWCGCSRDKALRVIPRKPKDIPDMYVCLKACNGPKVSERYAKAHCPLPDGRILPCPCCDFGHGSDEDTRTKLAQLESDYARLAAVQTKAGKAAFSKWRMEHARAHENIQPGQYGKPMFHMDMDDIVLDLLHLAELNMPKIPWKHGLLNNASDDARELISNQLKEWKHPLDCRRKDDNRCRAQKWFTGEAWSSFIQGTGGSPGGPRAIAKLALMMAEDLRKRGVVHGMGTEQDDENPPIESAGTAATGGGRGHGGRGRGRGRGRARGRAAFTEAVLSARQQQARTAEPESDDTPDAEAEEAGAQHIPTAIEQAADPNDLKVIRDLYGSRAQTIINLLLSFDAYFNWYYPLKESIPFLADKELREERAFENMRTAIDVQEIYERVTISNHKSFMPHGAVFKVTSDILKLGDTWSVCLSALELQNAETKRVATSSGSRNLTLRHSGECRAKPMKLAQGPARLLTTKGYGTTQALSTLRNLLVTQYLRRGDGIASIPDSRRKVRLFQHGRTSLKSVGNSAADRAATYDPRDDTCVEAFVRLLADLAESE